MQFFLHTPNTIRIINGSDEFTCTPAEFHALEPAYAGQPDIYWTPTLTLPADAPDCSGYVAKIADYRAAYPVIYAHVSLRNTELCANDDLPECLLFEAHIKASLDPEAPDLPVDARWIIRIRNEHDLVYDAIEVNFQNGFAEGAYDYAPHLPLGKFHIADTDFDRVTVGPTEYQVTLAAPVLFTIYRTV